MDLEAVSVASGWPLSVLGDASKSPIIARDVAEFLDFVCHGSHARGQMCVLAEGIDRLNLSASAPENLLQACASKLSAADAVLEAIDQDDEGAEVDCLDGQLYWWPAGERHREEVLGGDMRSKLLRFREFSASEVGSYVAELKRSRRCPHPSSGEHTDTLTTADVKDLCPQLPLFDRGHAFVGAANAGICLHVDQAWWSNIAKNFLGHKIVAVWGPDSDVLKTCGGELFRRPLSAVQERALSTARSVALLRPKDVASFSGGLPHATLVVGSELNLTFYESFLNWNCENLELLLKGARRSRDQAWWQNNMSAGHLKTVLEDIRRVAANERTRSVETEAFWQALCARQPDAVAAPDPDAGRRARGGLLEIAHNFGRKQDLQTISVDVRVQCTGNEEVGDFETPEQNGSAHSSHLTQARSLQA
ncbi:spoVK [Symbiodinium natans]|uniref:SpoVK protein n=1 Tax=Symbiodinium natans TaxID=878477 RepID=A0A812J9Y1_9DINO|nr:spoVK [Symbiodinium natans]